VQKWQELPLRGNPVSPINYNEKKCTLDVRAIYVGIRSLSFKIFVVCFCFQLCLMRCPAASAQEDPLTRVRELTKRILLTGIDLERYTLRFRRDSAKQTYFKRLRFFMMQEAGAACGMAYEIVAIDELREGRKNPLKIDKGHLRKGLTSALVGSTIAGSSSGVELTRNAILALYNKKHGMDPKSANEYVVSHVKQLDALLTEREALVAQHSNHELYAQAVLEGKLMRSLRDEAVGEYAKFYKDVKAYRAKENTFYAMNIATNVVGAVAAKVGMDALDNPKLNGGANILFTITGALTMASPLVANATGRVTGVFAERKMRSLLGELPALDYEATRTQAQEFKDSIKNIDQAKYPFAMSRASDYLQGSKLFQKQMNREVRIGRYVNKVAVESSFIAPPIGATLLTQGILGTRAFYKYEFQPRKNLELNYKGAIVGAVGTAVATGVTGVLLISDWAYYWKLKRENRLPKQMIEARLKHLDELQASVEAM
jgi:hypothetical protein